MLLALLNLTPQTLKPLPRQGSYLLLLYYSQDYSWVIHKSMSLTYEPSSEPGVISEETIELVNKLRAEGIKFVIVSGIPRI